MTLESDRSFIDCGERQNFIFVNTRAMSVGRTEYTVARRKWDLGTIFGIPKSCLQQQYPRHLLKNNLIGGSKFLAANLQLMGTPALCALWHCRLQQGLVLS